MESEMPDNTSNKVIRPTIDKLLHNDILNIISIFISVGLIFAFLYLCENSTNMDITNSRLSNIETYILTIFVFFISVIVSLSILVLIFSDKNSGLHKFFKNKIIYCIVLFFSYVFILSVFFKTESAGNTYSIYTYYRLPVPFVCMSVLLMIFWFASSYLILNKKKRSKIFRVITSAILLCLCAFFIYESNPFKDMGGGPYHIEAYVYSIFNVSDYVPYSRFVTGIYGHYAIFYLIPVKIISLFVSKLNAVIICVAFFGLLTYLFSFMVLNKLIKNDVIFAVGSISICIFSFMSAGNYYQLFPHRILFQPIILLYCLYIIKKQRLSLLNIFIGYVIATLSIIWNFEVGLICLATLVLCLLIFDIYVQKKPIFTSVPNKIICALWSITAAYVLVNIYNCFCGGGWIDFGVFIYPLGSVEYDVVDLLQVQLDLPLSNYFMAIALFLGAFTYSLMDICKGRITMNHVMIMCMACLGLGVMVYYINRPVHGNLYIVMVPLIITLALIVDIVNEKQLYCMPFKTKGYYSLISKVCMLSLLSMCLMSFVSIKVSIDKRLESSYERVSYDLFIDSIEVPHNTAFVGMYTGVVCASINHENIIDTMDWEDINNGGWDYVWKQIEDAEIEYVFINSDLLEETEKRYPDSRVIDEYIYDGMASFSLVKK